ncbi:hypothetical protein F511_30246 [Dorcoceras hygrometricum]|uniref:Uncharacterized protein n=1 Tax=Dorcoceras hygrometricum TaxID=472368 RepID=A0A2Z7A887_9LAMI|nr:hypothetical protein F511_30246 [Dorcoceras hygrometricum]
MKREGRQHGMVRAYEMLSSPGDSRPRRRMINEVTSPPTAGLFTRVPTKPTNHSKYTGKCGRPRCRGCHSHPVCKSMDKVKGARKIRSTLEGPQGLKFYGFSACGVLSYLDLVDREYDDDHTDQQQEEDVVLRASSSLALEIEEIADGVDVVVSDDDDDGILGFCEVGLVCEQMDGDDSWCLIDEI